MAKFNPMSLTPISKKAYILGLACIFFSQALSYTQAHYLLSHPVPVLLAFMDQPSSSAANNPNNNGTDKPPTGDNTMQASAPNEAQAMKESVANQVQAVQASVKNEVQSIQETVGLSEDSDSPKISKLKTLIIEESQKAGLINLNSALCRHYDF